MYETLLNAACSNIGFLLIISILTITASCECVRYYIKFTFFIIVSAIATTVFIPLMLWRIKDWRNALLPAWCIVQCAKILGITFRFRGKENIIKDTGCIVLLNHQSSLDLCVLGELWPVVERGTVISKREVLYLGQFGLAAWLWGTIFINRGRGGETHETINATAHAIKNLKAKLILFPEGHRHSGSRLQPFKKGAFHLAIGAQTPIQPIVISRYYFLNSKPKKFNSGVSYISILPAIPTEGLTKDDIPMLMEKTYEAMNKVFMESSEETVNEYVGTLKSD